MSSINCIWYVATSHGLTEMAVVVTGVRNALLFCQGKLCIKNVAKIVLDGRRKLRREISCLVILALDYMLLGKIFSIGKNGICQRCVWEYRKDNFHI